MSAGLDVYKRQVVKRSAVAPEMMVHSGPARVFDSEDDAIASIYAGKINKGDVVIIRYEGPKGGPGMREMLNPTSALAGMKLDKDVALITDGRFSGASRLSLIHISNSLRILSGQEAPTSVMESTPALSMAFLVALDWLRERENFSGVDEVICDKELTIQP